MVAFSFELSCMDFIIVFSLTSSTRPNPPIPNVAMTSRSLSWMLANSLSGLSRTGESRTSEPFPPLVLTNKEINHYIPLKKCCRLQKKVLVSFL